MNLSDCFRTIASWFCSCSTRLASRLREVDYRIFASISVSMWALGIVTTRFSLAYFHPFSISFLRYLVASVVLIGFVAAFKIKPPNRKDWIWVAACGLSGYTAYITLFKIASLTVTASTNSIVIATGPIIAAVLAWFIYKERLKAIQCFAFVMAFSGILIMALVNGSIDANIGVLIVFVGTIFLAIYNLITRKLVKDYAPMQVAIYSIFAGTVALGVFIPHSVADIRAGIPPMGYFYLFVLGVFSSALAFVSWTWAMKIAPKISYVTNFMFVTPFLTTLLGFLMANELPGIETLLGGVLILTGLAIFNFHDAMAKTFRRLVSR